MNVFTVAIEALIALSSLIAAAVATFRPQRLESLGSLFPTRGPRRVARAIAHWAATLATAAGMAVPFLVFFAACIAFMSSIPMALRAARSKSAQVWLLPALIGAGAIAMAIAQPLGLKVLALPKADELPYVPAPARVVKTYDEGLWFEGIASGHDGTLYLAGNRSLDFSRGDYYHDAQGELILRRPDGSERVIFQTPRGSTAGVPVVAADGTVFMTSHGERSGIWRIGADGHAGQLASLQSGAWPNGLDFGPDGKLYAPDSNLGLIWRVDPQSGRVDIALRDPALKARPLIALAPGANGLHFHGRDLLVTVSDRTSLLRYAMDEQGRFGPAAVIASGIPGDDFAIGKDGSIFVTTHPYNTLVRVKPDGERSIIGKAEQHIVGATDAVFGGTDQDRDTLYVVTDGGAFTGGAKTRGQLIAVEPYAKR